MLVLVVNLPDGLLDEVIKGDIILPSPVLKGGAVIERARPCLSDVLSEVRVVLDGEIGNEPKC